jgi:hypothetical protein
LTPAQYFAIFSRKILSNHKNDVLFVISSKN